MRSTRSRTSRRAPSPAYAYVQPRKPIPKPVLFLITALMLMIFLANAMAKADSALFAIFLIVLCCLPAVAVIAYLIYEARYFRSPEFQAIKARIQAYVDECNELNRHVEKLKEMPEIIRPTDYGSAMHTDHGRWNLSRRHQARRKYAPNVYNCSKTVLGNARDRPFEYVCKYFNVKADEATLHAFESVLNDFEAAEDGKRALIEEKAGILGGIQSDLPFLIRTFAKTRAEKELRFDDVDLATIYFPQYSFVYVSPGDNIHEQVDVVLDIENLNRFIRFLSDKVRFRKSAAGQRALMTSALRRKIKERDGYACRRCHVSVSDEPHLLLEIDHIVPVSRGGMTTESNLQTLCWKCNRSKGSRMP